MDELGGFFALTGIMLEICAHGNFSKGMLCLDKFLLVIYVLAPTGD